MIRTVDQLRLANWASTNLKGQKVRPASAALKMLEEVLELCYASGATLDEVMITVDSESNKAANRNEINGSYNYVDVIEEVGDVGITYAYFCWALGISSSDSVATAMDKVESREWVADEFGIMHRPR